MRTLSILLLVLVIAPVVTAQCPSTTGPDVIVGALTDVGNYGAVGGINGYALGATSCNIGTTPVIWIAGSNQHPVISQTVFRLKAVPGQPYSRFEQIGMSWLKHAFAATAGNLCGTCQGGGGGLGVCCSDTYGSGLNGSQSNGPRSEVNAANGFFPYPYLLSPPVTSVIDRRIQLQQADINPALNAGAQYFGEVQYVTADDAVANNDNNNASYRAMTFGASPSFTGSLTGATFQQLPAIRAWLAADPAVQLTNVDATNDGRFIVGKKITSLGGGQWHYEFAIYNLSSDRSGRGFTVDLPAGSTIANAGFKSIPYHSGEPYSSAPWNITVNGNSVNWATQLATVNPNANALRWGTMYNFWFDGSAATESASTIELFKPEPCPANPIVTPAGSYALNPAAAFDNPTLTAPAPGPTGDDSALTVPIGFSFNFYGTSYTSVSICTNGFLQFGGSANTYTNICLPNTGAPHGMVAAYWDDLITPPGSITYQTLGVAPNRRFVASWNAVGHFGATGTLESFKAILDETTNVITTTIVSTGGGGSSATRGIEDQTGNVATQASCNAGGSAVAGTSQTYTFTTVVIPSADLTVTGSTGPNGVLTWTINSNAGNGAVVLIASLDPGPLNLGPLGILNVGLTPGLYAVIADGVGALQAANPAHFTDGYCGDFSISIPLGPGGLPPGLMIRHQGVVFSLTSNPLPPNGVFHITDWEQTNT